MKLLSLMLIAFFLFSLVILCSMSLDMYNGVVAGLTESPVFHFNTDIVARLVVFFITVLTFLGFSILLYMQRFDKA